MFKIQTLNKISPIGLEYFEREKYEIASEIPNPDAMLVRSFKMHDMELPQSLLAVARAGAGVNNIPVEKCTEKGVVVFNTPGANANSVKELVLTGLFLSSRKIIQGIHWVKSMSGSGDEINQLIEKGKSNFGGPEIKGKTLGIIGLGAIGVLVANDAISLGMNVIGYDPFISIESAWGLSRNVRRAAGIESLIGSADYITLNVPLSDQTKGMLNSDRFQLMKKGVKILNFARGGLVNNADLLKAIEQGIVSVYITDFPDEELLKCEQVICVPHLGASTPEAEDNCAVMAVNQLKDFLEYGNIKNSVNFPSCVMTSYSRGRILIANKNIPKMVGQITAILASESINISDMINQHRENIAYNIIDIDQNVSGPLVEKIKGIEGVIMARGINLK